MNNSPVDKNNLSESSFESNIGTSVVTRTLVASGFTITNFRRYPRYGEYVCERMDAFGMPIPYVIAVCGENEPNENEMEYARHVAEGEGKVFVVVARGAGAGWVRWDDFLEALGGAIPSWRALSEEYPNVLKTTSRNKIPIGLSGEAWKIFEDAVADGLEFIFGRRVRRLGGRRPGQIISDMITQTSDHKILIIDAKASSHNYDVGGPELRPLTEYVKNQKIRQRGRLELSAAVLVANQFEQDNERLNELNGAFLSDTSIPLAFLEVDTMLKIVEKMRQQPIQRNTLRWARIFCSGGLVKPRLFEQELKAAIEETFTR
jgi:hypothetical protein